MSTDHDPSIALFAKVAAHHGVKWTPSASPKFGSDSLRFNGKIYAALTRKHQLLLKLPPARIAELLTSKRAVRFESGGRVMNGWITLAPDQAQHWIPLADEARDFLVNETGRERKSR